MVSRRGVTLLEMIVVVAVLAVVATVAMPMLADRSGTRLLAAETLLRDDLEQARHRTVATPDRPVSILFDPDGRGWRLVDAGDRTPIARIDGTPWTVRLGEGVAEGLDGVEVARTDDPAASALRFDATGVAISETTPRFRLGSGDVHRGFEVSLVTGLVRSIDRD